jgi:hypothetical protein
MNRVVVQDFCQESLPSPFSLPQCRDATLTAPPVSRSLNLLSSLTQVHCVPHQESELFCSPRGLAG